MNPSLPTPPPPSTQEPSDAITVTTARHKLGAALHRDQVFSALPRLDRLDTIDRNQCRAVDAGKLSGVEPSLQTFHRFPNQMRLVACLESNVVPLRLDPIDVRDPNEVVL